MTGTAAPGRITAQFTRLLNKVINGAVSDYYKNPDVGDLSTQRKDICDHAASIEKLVDKMAAVEILEALNRNFPKVNNPKQWLVLQAAREVTRQGVDPMEPREFYDAVVQWLEKNHPGSGIKRENIRIYWHYLCKTLTRICLVRW